MLDSYLAQYISWKIKSFTKCCNNVSFIVVRAHFDEMDSPWKREWEQEKTYLHFWILFLIIIYYIWSTIYSITCPFTICEMVLHNDGNSIFFFTIRKHKKNMSNSEDVVYGTVFLSNTVCGCASPLTIPMRAISTNPT